MSLAELSDLAQIIAAIAVVVSLIFVGLQIRQNTAALERNEHNVTMAEWTNLRMTIAHHRDIAEIMTAGLMGERALDAPDQLRLEQMLQEYAWAAFHIWDRTKRGVFPPGTFEATAGAYLAILLSAPRGRAWWEGAKTLGFYPQFVADMDRVLAKGAARPSS